MPKFLIGDDSIGKENFQATFLLLFCFFVKIFKRNLAERFVVCFRFAHFFPANRL
jgi:hypothetical protein